MLCRLLPLSLPPPSSPIPPPRSCEQYTCYRKPLVFNAICKLAMLLSTAVLVLGVVLVWLLYPRSYDYKQVGGRGAQVGQLCRARGWWRGQAGASSDSSAGGCVRYAPGACSLPTNTALLSARRCAAQALGHTMFFFDSQREGYLPLSSQVPWRGNAFTADYNTSATLASSLPNGTLDGFGVRRAGRGLDLVGWICMPGYMLVLSTASSSPAATLASRQRLLPPSSRHKLPTPACVPCRALPTPLAPLATCLGGGCSRQTRLQTP